MQALRSKLTYANVISTLCLFLVLGGSAYAATQLRKNSVGSRQIKNGAITGPKIKKASIEAIKLTALAQSTLQGAKGARGPKGATGAKGAKGDTGSRGANGSTGATGSSGAYATVLNEATPIFQGTHPGFDAVERVVTGVYCLTPAAGTSITHPLTSTDWLNSVDGSIAEPIAGGKTAQCANGKLEVHTYDFQGTPVEATPTDEVSFTVFAPGN
jgi:hypothetical protein